MLLLLLVDRLAAVVGAEEVVNDTLGVAVVDFLGGVDEAAAIFVSESITRWN